MNKKIDGYDGKKREATLHLDFPEIEVDTSNGDYRAVPKNPHKQITEIEQHRRILNNLINN